MFKLIIVVILGIVLTVLLWDTLGPLAIGTELDVVTLEPAALACLSGGYAG